LVVAKLIHSSRSASTKYPPSSSRPLIKRSNTTSSHTKSSVAPSDSHTTSTNKRSSGIFGGLFSSSAPQYQEPEKL
jgi:hypothetical protein